MMKRLKSHQRANSYVKHSVYRDRSVHAPASGGRARHTVRDQIEQAIDLLYRGRWIILLTFVAVFAAAAAYTYALPSIYEAESFALLARRGPADPNESRAYVANRAFAGEARSLANELTLLENSRSLPRAVARRLIELQTIPETGAAISILKAETSEPLTVEQVAQRVRKHVTFLPARPQGAPELEGRGTNAIRIVASSSSAHEAALLANLFAREYVALTRRASRASLTASRQFLEEQLKKSKEKLQGVEAELERYLSQREAAALDQKTQQLVSRIAQIEARRDAALVALKEHRASLHALEQRLEQLRPELVQRIASDVSQEIEFYHTKIAELKATKAEALLHNPQLGAEENPPQLREINHQIQQLQEKVHRRSQQYVDEVIAARTAGLTADAEGLANVADLSRQIAGDRLAIVKLEAEVAALKEQLKAYEAELSTLPEQSMELAELRRRQRLAQETSERIFQQLQKVRLREQTELGYARLIAEASVPAHPVRPDTRRYLILGAFLGLLLGIGLAIARYKVDNRIHKVDELHARGYNAAIIPNMQPLIEAEYQGQMFMEQDGQRVATSLVSLHHPMSPITEAYRQLRTNIQSSLPGAADGTLLVTSAGMDEGKSTTAANLALVFARAGRRTLLVDADLRQPQVHWILDLEHESGLLQLLRRSAPFSSVEDLSTRVENLYALPAGGTSAGEAAELIGSRRMRELLRTLQASFDVIVIDTPPVLLVEAKLLAPQCDATIVVARAGKTKERELDHAIEELRNVGSHVTGVVLNGFDLSMAYGYKYRYRHYSAHGYYGNYAG